MEFAVPVLGNREVSPLLASGHVGNIVKEMKNDDVVGRHVLQGLLDLDGHLLDSGLVWSPSPHSADDDFVTSVRQVVAFVKGMAAAYTEIAAGAGFINKHSVVDSVTAQTQIEQIVKLSNQ